MRKTSFDTLLRPLHIELLKLQRWVEDTGQRVLVLFEGRDAAGKGGVIKRTVKHLNPRTCRVVALTKPTTRERGQWYFQRYVGHLPSSGEIVLFDRSWYNRAGLERVMGFCTPEETEAFLRSAPELEAMLVRSGIRLFKVFLTVGKEEQARRLAKRVTDPLKRWKLTPLDGVAQDRWEAYSQAEQVMFDRTSTATAPWVRVDANDKRVATLNVIRYVLSSIDYLDKDEELLALDPGVVTRVDPGGGR